MWATRSVVQACPPGAFGELLEESAIEATCGAVIDVFNGSLVTQTELDRRARQSDHHWSNGRRQKLARLGLGPQGLPR